MIHLTDNLINILGFKGNIIEGKSGGRISGMERVIYADYPPSVSSNKCIFLYASFVETSKVSITNVWGALG